MLQFVFTIRNLPDVLALVFVTAVQAAWARALLRGPAARKSRTVRRTIVAGFSVSGAVVLIGFFMNYSRVERYVPRESRDWTQGIPILWAFLSVLLAAFYALGRVLTRPFQHTPSPARRKFLGAVRSAILGVPGVAVGYGTFIQRRQLKLREQKIPVAGLPADLDGLKIAQLTDIHLSPFLSVRELERAVAMANETRPNLTLVTGDLITRVGDPLDDCLGALSRLRADAGVYGCMGNHEVYAGSEDYTQREGARLGMTFLRRQSAVLRFGTADLNLAGVDYQRLGGHYLRGAEALVKPGAFNVLLSHNPDVFPVAAAKGFPLTIGGHTHGGQIRVELLGADLNVSRFYTPYVDGLYQKNGSSIFVSRGIGTIALPTRLGSPPEVALLTLWRI